MGSGKSILTSYLVEKIKRILAITRHTDSIFGWTCAGTSSNISESVDARDWRQQSPIVRESGTAVWGQQYGTMRKRRNAWKE